MAYIRENKRGDDFFTCSKCGPFNGKGKAFREWMAGIKEREAAQQNEPAQKKPAPIEESPKEVGENNVVETEVDDDDWLSKL